MLCFLMLLCLLTSIVRTQYPPMGGACPPALPVSVCYSSCTTDDDCQNPYKCCSTACGGSVCSRPVTARRLETLKSGWCPEVPTGRWVCSNTCTTDGDCRGRSKCCPNRCGALTCTMPQLM